MAAYVDHVTEQARWILQAQNVANMHTTPPLLDAIARNDTDVDLINQKIRWLLLSGAHVDSDTLDVLRDIFPETTITMAFGSTMILSQASTRVLVETDCPSLAFDPRTPYVVFWVVDPDTGETVPYGERGQVVMNHISKGMFIPNNVERDSAIRLARARGADRRLGRRGQAGRDVRGRGRRRGCVLIAIRCARPDGRVPLAQPRADHRHGRRSGRRPDHRAEALRGARPQTRSARYSRCRSRSRQAALARSRRRVPELRRSAGWTSKRMCSSPAAFPACRSRRHDTEPARWPMA